MSLLIWLSQCDHDDDFFSFGSGYENFRTAYEPIVARIVEFALIVTITFQTASTRMRQAIVDYNNPGSV